MHLAEKDVLGKHLPDSDCHRLNCGNVCESDPQEDLRLFGVTQCRPFIILRSLEQRVIACLHRISEPGEESISKGFYSSRLQRKARGTIGYVR